MASIENGIYWDDLTPEAQERLSIHNSGNNDTIPLASLYYELEFEDYCHQGEINGLDIFWHEEEEEFFVLDGDAIIERFTSIEDAKEFCNEQ